MCEIGFFLVIIMAKPREIWLNLRLVSMEKNDGKTIWTKSFVFPKVKGSLPNFLKRDRGLKWQKINWGFVSQHFGLVYFECKLHLALKKLWKWEVKMSPILSLSFAQILLWRMPRSGCDCTSYLTWYEKILCSHPVPWANSKVSTISSRVLSNGESTLG